MHKTFILKHEMLSSFYNISVILCKKKKGTQILKEKPKALVLHGFALIGFVLQNIKNEHLPKLL